MSRSRKPWRAYGRYGTVGIELVLSICLGYYGGAWLDRRWNTRGWLAGAGFLVGCYAGFKALWIAAKRMERDVLREEAQDRGEDPWDLDPPRGPREAAPREGDAVDSRESPEKDETR